MSLHNSFDLGAIFLGALGELCGKLLFLGLICTLLFLMAVDCHAGRIIDGTGRRVLAEVLEIDPYRRAVAVIRLDGRDINREMVADGIDWPTVTTCRGLFL